MIRKTITGAALTVCLAATSMHASAGVFSIELALATPGPIVAGGAPISVVMLTTFIPDVGESGAGLLGGMSASITLSAPSLTFNGAIVGDLADSAGGLVFDGGFVAPVSSGDPSTALAPGVMGVTTPEFALTALGFPMTVPDSPFGSVFHAFGFNPIAAGPVTLTPSSLGGLPELFDAFGSPIPEVGSTLPSLAGHFFQVAGLDLIIEPAAGVPAPGALLLVGLTLLTIAARRPRILRG